VTLLDAAAALVERLLRFDAPTETVLRECLRDDRAWGSKDRELLADVAYAVLRRWSTLRGAARSGGGGAASSGLDGARRLALLAWPIGAMGAIARAGVDATTLAWLEAARARHRALVEADADHDLPPWLAARLREQDGAGFDALASSLLEPAPLDLRVNTMRASRDEVREALARAGIESAPTRWSPWGLRVVGKPPVTTTDAWRQGLIEVQDEGSQLLALLVDARRGEMVADFCAGAGGKTLALGAAMAGTGRVYAIDASAARLAALSPRLARSRLRNVYTMAVDDERDPRLAPLTGKMDRVLVDAPCSGLGTLRRSPELKWRVRESDVDAMARRQSSILDAAARLVKPGGVLVYATCSLLDAENGAVVERFLVEHRDFRTASSASLFPRLGASARELVGDGVMRLTPDRHGTDGFIAATLWREP
jgi:16S rRNA (cytosine967-C5)-methyltransferase